MQKITLFLLFFLETYCAMAQGLPPKQPAALTVKQIHSGHSLTDPLFANWPGQYVELIAHVNNLQAWQLFDAMVGKSTGPGSSIMWRWNNPMGFGSPDARLDIADWELLSITERVPMAFEGGNTQPWYLDAIQEQKHHLSLFVNNAWTNGSNGNGVPTLLWSTWTNIDNSDGPWRQMLDIQGAEFERMQDYANANRPAGAPPVYIIPGHKMMARIYDDIALGLVPGITNINQFFSDNIHPNTLGAYAVSMIHYACIFNQNPLGLPNNLLLSAPSGTPIPSPDLATYLQSIVWEVVTQYPRTGITDAALSATNATADNYDFSIYPNPANDMIFIKKTNVSLPSTYQIQDFLGKIVSNGNDAKVEIGHLPSGVYLIRIGRFVRKFVKN